MPVTGSPYVCWNASTACFVAEPKIPSTVTVGIVSTKYPTKASKYCSSRTPVPVAPSASRSSNRFVTSDSGSPSAFSSDSRFTPLNIRWIMYHVARPMMPSSVRPNTRWNSRTAASVSDP